MLPKSWTALYAADLAKDVGSPPKGSRFYVIVDGSFIFGDFIEALIVENAWTVEEMTISTLSMSLENVDSLAGLLDQGYVKSLNLIVSDFFFAHERHALVKELYNKLDKDDRFQLAVAGVHTKICLIRTVGGNRIVIHGSANLRTSANIEQVMIENNDDMYAFNHEIHGAIIERYKTINTTVRSQHLWQAVVQGSSASTPPAAQLTNTAARQSNAPTLAETQPTREPTQKKSPPGDQKPAAQKPKPRAEVIHSAWGAGPSAPRGQAKSHFKPLEDNLDVWADAPS